MRAHIIQNGIVVNTIMATVAEAQAAFPGATVIDGATGAIGDTWDGAAFTSPPAPPAPLAESVPMLNLQLILIEDGKLSAVQTILDSMIGDDGAKAQAYWSKALTARRDNYLVAQLWPAIGYTEAEFNDAWARAAALNP